MPVRFLICQKPSIQQRLTLKRLEKPLYYLFSTEFTRKRILLSLDRYITAVDYPLLGLPNLFLPLRRKFHALPKSVELFYLAWRKVRRTKIRPFVWRSKRFSVDFSLKPLSCVILNSVHLQLRSKFSVEISFVVYIVADLLLALEYTSESQRFRWCTTYVRAASSKWKLGIRVASRVSLRKLR